MSKDPKRAFLFETAAEQYEQFRPSYPITLIDRLLERCSLPDNAKVLEIGCGTGKATRQLAARGLQIDCIDPGEHLISIAKKACAQWPAVRFFVGKFEELALSPGSYDLVFAAQAFHWTDPATRWKRSHDYLSIDGSIVLLYNYSVKPVEGPNWQLSDLIQRASGGEMVAEDPEEKIREWVAELSSSKLFSAPLIIRERWTRRQDAQSYLGTFQTYSDYMALAPKDQAVISDVIVSAVEKNGGVWETPFEAVAIHARKIAAS